MLPTPRSVAISLGLLWGIAHWLQGQTVPTPTPVTGNFKTVYGQEYKDATVSRVEPDGIVLRTKSGISKIYFSELPKEVQERFHYDAAKAAEFTSEQNESIRLENERVRLLQQQQSEEAKRRTEEREKYQREQAQIESERQAEIQRQQQAAARQQQAELQRAQPAQAAKRNAVTSGQNRNQIAAQQQALQRHRALQQDPEKLQKPTETALDYLERRAAARDPEAQQRLGRIEQQITDQRWEEYHAKGTGRGNIVPPP